MSSSAVFDEIMSMYADKLRLDKDIWAEKTPRNCLSYDWLAKENPALYFISMIRDGRDVVTSTLDEHSPYHCSIDRYVETLEAIYSFDKLGYRHLIVRYEEMVRQPENISQTIFAFLGLEYEPRILVSYREASPTRSPEKVRQTNVQNAISPKWVGRWREPCHAERIREFMADERAVGWLSHTGYASDKVSEQALDD